MINRTLAPVALAFSLALLTGCVHSPDRRADRAALQTEFNKVDGQGVVLPAAATPWWQSLQDSQLDQLIEQGIKANKDLQAAGLRLQAAYQQLGYDKAQQWPQGSLDARLNRQQLGDNRSEDSALALNARWELDLFGRIASLVAAAQANADSAQAYQRQVYVELVSGIAQGYFNWQVSQQQHRVVSQQIGAMKESIALLQARFDEGYSSALELHRAKAQLAEQQGQLPALEASMFASQSALAVLLARDGQQLALQPSAIWQRQLNPSLLLNDLPNALAYHPSVQMALSRLLGEDALSDAAHAALYPTISVAGMAGWLNPASLSLGQGEFATGVTPTVSWSLLSLPALNAKAKAQQSLSQAAYHDYEQSVIKVVNQGQVALNGLTHSAQVVSHADTRLNEAKLALKQADDLYQQGAEPYLTLLDARQEVLVAEREALAAKNALLQAKVDGYRAFSGLWSPRQIAITR